MRSPARTGVVCVLCWLFTPTMFCVRSISGNRRKIYDCRMTRSTVAPAVLRTAMITCASGRAVATSTSTGASVAEDINRALAEGVDLSVGNLVEDGAEREAAGLVGELEIHVERHLAGLLAQRLETPVALEAAERPFDQPHFDHLIFLQSIAGGKGLLEATARKLERGPHLVVVTTLHLRRFTPRQKLRIGVDVVHQRIHLRRTIRHQGTAIDNRHDGLTSVGTGRH